MIAKISRGWRVGGLLRYLMGRGRYNEHKDQRVVATWDHAPHLHQPRCGDGGTFDLTDLSARLSDPAAAAGVAQVEPTARNRNGKTPRGPVWHCSLRNHAEDGVLSDAEWSRIVADLMDRTGIAPAGDTGACRWVAIRHADDHVHVAAVLVRQDSGKRVHPRNDYFRAREVCIDSERRLRLVPTSAADRTGADAPTRAELEKAVRRGAEETSREWLRRAARVAAVQTRDPAAYFRRLGDLGVLVRPRRSSAGELVGYALAVPGDNTAEGLPVWFSGRRLARELALPQLLARWGSAPPPPPSMPSSPGERSRVGRAERNAAVGEATSAIEDATAVVAAADSAQIPSIAHATGDMVVAATAAAGPTAGGLPIRGSAADAYGRAAGTPGLGQPDRWSPVAQRLRTAAWRLVLVRSLGSRAGADAGIGELLAALAVLVAEIAAYRERAESYAQARAAHRSARLLCDHPSGAGRHRPGGGHDEGTPARRATAVPLPRSTSPAPVAVPPRAHERHLPGTDRTGRTR